MCVCMLFFFFFSSRRRHTRYIGDWSSDVCSSDLLEYFNTWSKPDGEARIYAISSDNRLVSLKEKIHDTSLKVVKLPTPEAEMPKARSEERRVGKEWRYQWETHQREKK